MRVGWIIGIEDWAFKNLMNHNSKALPGYEHKINDYKADVIIVMSPPALKNVDRTRAIAHLDSQRIIGL